MEEKNRFGKLLDQMMSAVDMKNYTLSKALKYDVSYISKWVNGHILPSEKTAEQIIGNIIRCIISSANEGQKQMFLQDYQVHNEQELEAAMYDHLKCEYDYARIQQKSQNAANTSYFVYYPELSLAQFIVRQNHPVLRRVSSLNIMASMDLLSMEHEYRLHIVSVQHEWAHPSLTFPNVHFSLSIDIERWAEHIIYDTIFLLNLLSSCMHIDFKLYGSSHSRGHLLFAVEKDFSIAGLLMDQRRCLSVVVSEDPDTAQIMYENIKHFCVRENLLFRKTTIAHMIQKNGYLQTLLGQNNCWLMGRLTEHFLPDDLFEELLESVWEQLENNRELHNKEELKKLHMLTCNMLETVPLRVLVYETAFQDMIVNRQIDFFNQKITLTETQCKRYLQHLFGLVKHQPTFQFRLIQGQFVSDYRYVTSQCLFLNDAVSYLYLDNESSGTVVLVANRSDVKERLKAFFEEIWSEKTDCIICGTEDIHAYLDDTLRHFKMIYGLQ
ncbi:MAG: hypothetical protein Q4D42_02150 [Eubacteriales bacterium]|nr:hypothetical protein [Eubacteriales bacterium]